ncbi:Gfo/Idh/MocA family oxidoreductase [Nakamurella sp. A5-74]|uniref:Gfo/Idh/MocA family oxidoreductase n=1 Tax=Nakamurella sp. A5-74 TaxID=3158264 RepID=A0AAU8DNL0_9ACTN
MAEVRPIRVAVLGTGFFGTALATAAQQHQQFDVIAVSDLNAESAEALATAVGARTANPRELISCNDVDLVMVATPNHTHAATAIELLRAGRHVFVEKPLAITRTDVEDVLAAAHTSQGLLMVGHILRCLPGVQRLHREATSGALGQLLEGRAVRSRLVHLPEDTADWWKLDRRRSGGELLHEIHELDLLVWIFGVPDATRCVAGATPDRPGDHAPTVHRTTMTFQNNAIAVHEVSTSAHHPEWSLRVTGREAALVADFRTSTVVKYVDGTVTEQWELFNGASGNDSLRAASRARQAYNAAGATTPEWMQQAVAAELDEVAAAIHRGSSALLAQPGTAVLTALRAEDSDAAVPVVLT